MGLTMEVNMWNEEERHELVQQLEELYRRLVRRPMAERQQWPHAQAEEAVLCLLDSYVRAEPQA
ncbi:hypothetical protein [Microvirga arsenatis]|uniref:Uncharacterized protein n=1 Tax=Microvirga arsenatis TaxID=2692265 RepID=A0ABW9YXF1_9HYPH|nr:hypothetical protein [Microvirga arsenatis]NBJ09334.1 hypothetical protein [Microvirga arsenatis]NBJ23808.1 hypothetical protein [Microvirga arsenatis]